MTLVLRRLLAAAAAAIAISAVSASPSSGSPMDPTDPGSVMEEAQLGDATQLGAAHCSGKAWYDGKEAGIERVICYENHTVRSWISWYPSDNTTRVLHGYGPWVGTSWDGSIAYMPAGGFPASGGQEYR
jgi:hypothetical protein